jgi:quercetin dioxygenase-like cupin family protein
MRVASESSVSVSDAGGSVRRLDLVPGEVGSPLALSSLRIEAATTMRVGDDERDTLVYASDGAGSLVLESEGHALEPHAAALVLAGEEATIETGDDRLVLVQATVGPEAERHAPLGPREHVVAPDRAGSERATGARSFRILLGPHNGSTRATLFAGYVPPGKAPWHYHLYDEIVWIPEGPGRLHLTGGVEELTSGSAFRLHPREVHIVENTSPDRELVVIGVFTPAGSPSAAYLTADVADEYRFSG